MKNDWFIEILTAPVVIEMGDVGIEIAILP